MTTIECSTCNGPQSSDESTCPECGRDLTELAKQNKLDPVIGREREIERVIQILCRRSKNNPVLNFPKI